MPDGNRRRSHSVIQRCIIALGRDMATQQPNVAMAWQWNGARQLHERLIPRLALIIFPPPSTPPTVYPPHHGLTSRTQGIGRIVIMVGMGCGCGVAGLWWQWRVQATGIDGSSFVGSANEEDVRKTG
jgi:hypothetical protein